MSNPTTTPERCEELADKAALMEERIDSGYDFTTAECGELKVKLRELAEMKRGRAEKAFALERDGTWYIDQDGESWETLEDWLFMGVLGGCKCGTSEELGGLALRVLALLAQPHESRTWSIRDDERAEIIAHWMYSRELLEHGSSIGGAWLTEKGKRVYATLLPFFDNGDGEAA